MIINKTGFGWIEIDNRRYNTDIIIYPNGTIEDRYKDFKGDNHIISKWEAEKVIKQEKPEVFIVGTGQAGIVSVLGETKKFLSEQGIKLIAEPTPQAIQSFNHTTQKKCAIFHVTC
ncbi:MAG: MTH938/NDUFAF3 family protein [candidate division WOR-3 bacterium]|nr:MTH938/NDUFAF3 family protein [candidate division WOR-3 bacterium]